LDGTIRHLLSGEEICFDVAAIHYTCHTKLALEVRLTKQRLAVGKDGNVATG
jgi:hypothetical protein